MKTNIKMLVLSGFVMFATLTSCEKENSDSYQYASVLDVAIDGTSTMLHQPMQAAFVETATLTYSELEQLLQMKEEEKLARDVYSALNQQWGSMVFSRISAAENNHLTAIINLLKFYNEADTMVSEAGVFTNGNTQLLYTDLLAKGSVSVNDAYKTGALIEEMDINDLKEGIAATTNANILMVYENLERGSRNHLRAFNKQLGMLGGTYTPAYLTQDEYNQILTSGMEKGKQYKMNGKGKGNGQGQGNGNGKGNGNGQHKGKGRK
ncbi:MAG TPA: DUF2202 domain-containing protein [Bacteroidales bacterium]|nr:DUF2202 domain-containing protein [Bacteroidales bacterium]